MTRALKLIRGLLRIDIISWTGEFVSREHVCESFVDHGVHTTAVMKIAISFSKFGVQNFAVFCLVKITNAELIT